MMDSNLPTFKSNRSDPKPLETSSAIDDGSHLDEIRMPDLENQTSDPDAPFEVGDDGVPIDAPPPEMVDKDAFWVVFQTAFNLPGQLMRDLKPLAIQDVETQGARAASDATHSLLEIYYPAALMPQSETLAHILVAAPFFIGKVLVVREILRAMKAKPVSQDKHSAQDKPSAQAKQKPAQTDAAFEDWILPGQEEAA